MITTADIQKLAQLARIDISPEETETMRTDIESILAYVGHVNDIAQADGSDKKIPLVRNVMRPDSVTHTSGEFTETLLSAAPAREGNYFKVKKILQ